MRSGQDQNNELSKTLPAEQHNNMRADNPILDKWSSDHHIQTVSGLESVLEKLLEQRFDYKETIYVFRNDYEIGDLSYFPPHIQKQYQAKIELEKKKLFDDYLKSSTNENSNQILSNYFLIPHSDDTEVNVKLELTGSAALTANYKEKIDEIKKYKEGQESANSGMGSIVLDQNYIVLQYQDYVKKINPPDFAVKLWGPTKILDIGTATGKNSYSLLGPNTILVANDLSKKDLLSLRARVPSKLLSNLFLNFDTFPYKMDQQENSFDAVLLSHVLHYLTPSQMQTGFRKAFSWLKPGGNFFIQALTPYSRPYFWRGHSFHNISQFSKGNATFISYCQKSFKEASQSFGTLCDSTIPANKQSHHPIDHKDLKRELEKAGFEIKLMGYTSLFQKEKPTLTCEETETYIMSQSISKKELAAVEEKTSHSPEILTNLKQTRKTYQTSVQSYKDFLQFKVAFERARDIATTISDAPELHQHFSTIWPILIKQLEDSKVKQKNFAHGLGLFDNRSDLKEADANATQLQIAIAKTYKDKIDDVEQFKRFIESQELYQALGTYQEPLYYFYPASTVVAIAVKPKL